MLEQLMDLIKQHSQEAVVNNPDVPNDKNNAVIAEATNTVASGLQNLAAGGGLQNILSLFGGGGGQPQTGQSLMSNPIVNMMVGHFTGKLMNNFGLGSSQASGVANSLIPNVLSGLINKTNDPNNSGFTLDGILHSLTGGQSTQVAQQQQAAGNPGFSFQNLIQQFTGGGSGSGSGIMDIVSKIAGGAQNLQQQSGSGGLMNIIKGLL